MRITLSDEDASLALREIEQEVLLLREFSRTAHQSCIADPRRRYSIQASDLESLYTSLSALGVKLGSLCSMLYEGSDGDLVVLEKDLTNSHTSVAEET